MLGSQQAALWQHLRVSGIHLHFDGYVVSCTHDGDGNRNCLSSYELSQGLTVAQRYLKHKGSFDVYSTNGDPPHGVRAAGFFWLQNPGLTVDLIKDVPELSQGLQNQQELAVKLVQSTLRNQTRTRIAATYETMEF